MSQSLTKRPTTRPKAIIFDWDNTLIDSWQVIQEAFNATFDDYDLPHWSLAETEQRVAKSMRDSFPKLFGEDWEQAGKVFHGHFKKIHLDRLAPLPNVGEALSELAAMGIYLGVVSNKTGAFLRAEAEKLGWDKHFGHIIGAGDAPHDKPATEPVRMALHGSGIEAGQDVWFAGDAGIDLECAKKAGCIPVLVREKAPEIGEFTEFKPSIHFTNVQMLSNHAKNM
ncbi:MAG: HAD family hydrolase [Magnetovibrio sp.]|nr:HAD family hydrolase [Magnetovibrio sp.]